MAAFPAMPFFTDAYLADTRHLTTIQHGAYLLMLMTAWRSTDCSLPNDDKYLARITGMDMRMWMKNREVVLAFWKINDQQKWVQGRQLDERNYVEQLRSKNSVAGRASALKRNNRGSTSVQPERNETSTPTPTPTPTPSSGAKAPSDIPCMREGYSPAFIELWELYPRHDCSKSEALKSYKITIKEGIDHGRLIEGVRAFRNYVERTGIGQRYIPHASTWLNQRRWESEYSNDRAFLDSKPSDSKRSRWEVAGQRIAAKYRAEADREGNPHVNAD